MIEGMLHHCTAMAVDRQYVDSHGQSAVALAFRHLLGFQLLPRLKAIHKQRLYRPEAGHPEAYPNLQPITARRYGSARRIPTPFCAALRGTMSSIPPTPPSGNWAKRVGRSSYKPGCPQKCSRMVLPRQGYTPVLRHPHHLLTPYGGATATRFQTDAVRHSARKSGGAQEPCVSGRRGGDHQDVPRDVSC